MHSTLWKYSTSWKFSLHSVYIFGKDWNFWTKFQSTDLSFNRNILAPLNWKFKTCAHVRIPIVIYKYLDFMCIFSLHWRYVLMNDLGQWFYELDCMSFSKNLLWSVICTYYVQMSTLLVKVDMFSKGWHFAQQKVFPGRVTWSHSWLYL